MIVKILDDYEKVSEAAALIVKALMISKPQCILGLATGSTPIGLYQSLVRSCKNGEISFRDVRTFNLDEYVGIDMDHPESYHCFMEKHLFDHVDIPKGSFHVPWTDGDNAERDCERYDRSIFEAGGIDLQILGIGGNGHIAFNEPADFFTEETHITTLDERTIRDNARFFDRMEDVPVKAMTVGMGVIMHARRIVMLATGANKADAVYRMLCGEITPRVPASVLRLHPDAVLFLDREAANRIEKLPFIHKM